MRNKYLISLELYWEFKLFWDMKDQISVNHIRQPAKPNETFI